VCAKFNITIKEKVKIFNLLSVNSITEEITINTYIKNFEQFKKTEFKKKI